MNINPYSPTTPHYDSYEDFYKFFEVSPRDVKEGIMPIEVFPLVEPMRVEKQEKITETKQDKKRESR